MPSKTYHMPKTCSPGCCVVRFKPDYALIHFKKTIAFCKTSGTHKVDEWTLLDCKCCGQRNTETAFPPNQRTANSAHSRVCVDCIEKRKCIICFLFKTKHIVYKRWMDLCKSIKQLQGTCCSCMQRTETGWWTCHGCKNQLPIAQLSSCQKPRKDKRNSNGALCNMNNTSTAMVLAHRISMFCKTCYNRNK